TRTSEKGVYRRRCRCGDRRIDGPLWALHDSAAKAVSARARSRDTRGDQAGEGDELKIAIVVSDYNSDVTSLMLERARAHAEALDRTENARNAVDAVVKMIGVLKKLD